MTPLLSVITPSYNLGSSLERTVCSVLNNTRINLEYIVVDGMSTDNTISILKKYSSLYPNKFRFICENDSGQTNAINKGIRLTTGKWVAWLNADDYYESLILDKMSNIFVNNMQYSLIYGNNVSESKKGIKYNIPPSYIDFDRMRNGNVIFQPASFIQRKYLNLTGLLDENLHYWMDYDIFLRLIRYAQFKYINELISHFTVRPGQISYMSHQKEMNIEAFRVWFKNSKSIRSKLFINQFPKKIRPIFERMLLI